PVVTCGLRIEHVVAQIPGQRGTVEREIIPGERVIVLQRRPAGLVRVVVDVVEPNQPLREGQVDVADLRDVDERRRLARVRCIDIDLVLRDLDLNVVETAVWPTRCDDTAQGRYGHARARAETLGIINHVVSHRDDGINRPTDIVVVRAIRTKLRALTCDGGRGKTD